jgi:hypothetical protein
MLNFAPVFSRENLALDAFFFEFWVLLNLMENLFGKDGFMEIRL